MPKSEDVAGPADPEAARDLWLSCMKPAQEHGTLEKQPTRRARTPREREQAKTQNYWLTRRVMGMPAGYDRIKWKHDLEGKTA